uniref:HAD-superfamily phosphatase subfamily IIIA n=1 Tax=Paulinella chromatophora TaxID=39717 RepID=B1X3P4_PAUCH|nr:HAD-superfamily phosphatase subfamily IIIA [Paulinella chromatophora]ACB42563.1 HAD-superfamily phosphatase subfamily IIIA [Paulinella chromatophora]
MILKQLLQPDWDLDYSLPELPLNQLIRRHFRALILDVDCTLVPNCHSHLPVSVEGWLNEAKDYFDLWLFSNNPSNYHIGKLAKKLNLPFRNRVAKPRIRALQRLVSEINLPYNQIAIIGDRIFSDILTGNRLGLFTVLVNPVTRDGYSRKKQGMQNVERELTRWIGGSVN